MKTYNQFLKEQVRITLKPYPKEADEPKTQSDDTQAPIKGNDLDPRSKQILNKGNG